MINKLITLIFVVLCANFAFAQSGTIFVVRHAEKASAERDTALSDAGLRRADCLAKTLREAQIKSAFVTEFKRTQQTAEPEAKQAGITATVVPAAETAQTITLAKKAAASGNILIVGHSNTVPQIVQSLAGESKPNPMADSEYDRLSIIQFGADGKPQLTILHYCINDSAPSNNAMPKMQ
jgi:phosphohistidine phosphatase SixA